MKKWKTYLVWRWRAVPTRWRVYLLSLSLSLSKSLRPIQSPKPKHKPKTHLSTYPLSTEWVTCAFVIYFETFYCLGAAVYLLHGFHQSKEARGTVIQDLILANPNANDENRQIVRSVTDNFNADLRWFLCSGAYLWYFDHFRKKVEYEAKAFVVIWAMKSKQSSKRPLSRTCARRTRARISYFFH